MNIRFESSTPKEKKKKKKTPQNGEKPLRKKNSTHRFRYISMGKYIHTLTARHPLAGYVS